MPGSTQLSWRYACPAERHRGLKRRSNGFYCQSCDLTFDSAIDLTDEVAVSPADVRKSKQVEGLQ